MNDKPTRDDYNQLIDQLGSSDRNDGPDILAVKHRREEGRAPAQSQRQAAGEQSQRRVTQYTPGADRQRRQGSASGQPAHNRAASSRGTQHRAASSKRTTGHSADAAQQTQTASHTSPKRKTKEKKPGFGGSAWVRAIIIVLIIASVLQKFRNSRLVSNAFYGLRPASTGLIAAAGISVAVSTFLPQIALSALNWKGLILGVALWVLTNLIKPTKKLHPIVFIGLAAVVGIVFSM